MNTKNLRTVSTSGRATGFTLIELLAVLALMVLFVSIVAPKMATISDNAKMTANNLQIAYLKAALKAYKSIYGRYPTTEEGLEALIRPVTPVQERNWKGPLLDSDEIPKDPWGREYIYRCPGIEKPYSYDLYSLGPPTG